MKCDQCDSVYINGLFCHERGCPNSDKTWVAEEERWVRFIECSECGEEVEEDEHDCSRLELLDYAKDNPRELGEWAVWRE